MCIEITVLRTKGDFDWTPVLSVHYLYIYGYITWIRISWHRHQWFQQDGATCHTARETMGLLHTTFQDCIITRNETQNWPLTSCDLTPLDFFLSIKSKVLTSDHRGTEERNPDENRRCRPGPLWASITEFRGTGRRVSSG